MTQPRLVAIITALMLVAGQGGQAQVSGSLSVGELQTIEGLILSKDCNALWSHLNANPRLMATNDALGRELRQFYQDTESGSLDCFASRSGGVRPTDLTGDVY